MSDLNALEKTNRINLLFDYYGSLLTEKQRTFLIRYYHDDESLGEIADEYQISRQAVYEHIKRAQMMLHEYEDKLRLLARHEERVRQIEQIAGRLTKMNDVEAARVKEQVLRLLAID